MKSESDPDEPEEEESESMSYNLSDYAIRRISWSEGLDTWYVITERMGGEKE
ncbi:MAG: hypothetical protein OSA84_05005 [Akkermansiaceae bacterium]|nr:hypothetical protein [Akkermansiaceae bacterium]